MSLHFVIDGYNLIKQAPSIINKIKLQDSRVALIRFLVIHHPQGSRNNRVTVVFDGRKGNYYHRSVPAIEAVFSQADSADDKIKSIVSASQNPKNIIVVTNDKDIRFFVRDSGAQVKTIGEFLSKFTEQSAHKGGREEAEDKVVLMPGEAAKITDELKKIWLAQK